MDLISVIVPVYKVEVYLNRCVESIVKQSYTNLEIILVDDGSPDRCPEMCDAWGQKDKRIKVIHKENGGLSDARNAGMAIATGTYIGFVDSDDWIDTDFYEKLLFTLKENHAQLCASDVVYSYDDHHERGKRYCQTVFSPQQALQTIMQGNGFHATAWNKLYAASLIAGFEYPVGRLHEDEFVTYQIIAKAQRLALCQETAYYYRQRSGSIMSSGNEKHLDAIDAFLERLQFFSTNFPELYQMDKPRFCGMLVNYFKLTFSDNGQDAKKIQKRLVNYRRLISYSLGEVVRYTIKQQIYIIGTAINLHLFSRLVSFVNQ